MQQNTVPRSLKNWFIFHFIVDIIFAIPLVFGTPWFVSLLGFPSENLILARLVGAALFAIGTISVVMHNSNLEQYRVMLTFKVLWSASAIVAIAISLYEGAPSSGWIFLFIFLFFLVIWSYYKLILKPTAS